MNVGRRTVASATDPSTGQLFIAAGWAGSYLNSAETSAGLDLPPGVVSITPHSGPSAGGTPVTISGNNFDPGAQVQIGGNDCDDIVVVDVDTITCDTPAGASGPADVTVTNPDTLSGTLVDGFLYLSDVDEIFEDRFEE